MDQQTEEVIGLLYEQLKDPRISSIKFDEIVRKIERLKALA